MKVKNLQSGMRALIMGTIEQPKEYVLVLDNELFIFKVASEKFSGSWSKTKAPITLKAVWLPNTPNDDNIGIDLSTFMTREKYWKLVWEDPATTVEMTLTQICEALGKNIKIVKEQ